MSVSALYKTCTPERRTITSSWSCRAVGLLGTVLIHALYFQAVMFGATALKIKRPPEESGPGASAILSSTGEWMTVVTIRLPGITRSDFPVDIASRGMAPTNVAIQIASPDPLPAFDTSQETEAVEDANSAVTVGDPAMQSLLFGRYIGQINARIQRAWRKPRSSIGAVESPSADAGLATADDRFRCQARIVQDERGNVREIELVSCNGSPQWQQSLVNAIQTSSPLPAPPSRSVFSNQLTLTFEGRAYAAGMSDEEYESRIQVGSRELGGIATTLLLPFGGSLRDSFDDMTTVQLPADAPASPPVEFTE